MEIKRKYVTGIYTPTFDLDAKDETRYIARYEAFFEDRALIIDKNAPDLFMSPEFEWGSRSRGSKQLAHSILLEFTDKVQTIRYADELVINCLMLIPSRKSFQIQTYAIKKWLECQQNNEQFDLMMWTRIDEPNRQTATPVEEKKPAKSLIIPPPPIESRQPKGAKRMSAKNKKYPLYDLEPGQYFYFINPRREEMQKISVAMARVKKHQGKQFIRRLVSSEWARDNGIDIPQKGIPVCIVQRLT